ncbi:DUF2484 family protein [Falsirhodobacter halotolerans]|uniref:DUF2484 family protein n=1 Tax=Falsirhodobacter halotolerans TaxID=1146892 RepID=UPI001FD4867A|nr:DUF2484 family protein [Falsirhodobacter halotolerans]MCJ8140303.1 DUF2484 family protein [Falsirhodobacter halotolerans]
MIAVSGLAAVWFVAALALSGRVHAPTGWALTFSGIPVLGLVTWQFGPLIGLIALMVALFLLRTPLRAVRRRAGRAVE